MYLQTKVDQYYPMASIYEAMEIWSLPKHKTNMLKSICDEEKYFAQVKKDGNWYEFSKSALGVNYLFSRGVSTKTGLPVESMANVPHLAVAFESLPNDTVIIGEIYYPGETSNEVRSIMGCLPKKAVERQKEKGPIHFYLHDILRYDGKDLTGAGAEARYVFLQSVIEEHDLLQYDFIENATAKFTDIYNFLVDTMAAGEEGAVLKLKTAPYSEGKRPAWSMIKWKKQDTVDLVSMGFEDATMEYTGSEVELWQFWINEDGSKIKGKHYGTPGFTPVTKPYFYGWKTGMRLGAYDEGGDLQYIATVSSGLNDDLRSRFATSPDEYIGKVVEIQCMELTEDSIRHPVLIRFRDDKSPSSCQLKNIFS